MKPKEPTKPKDPWTPVNSSRIKAVHYTQESGLSVQFHRPEGVVYRYPYLSEASFKALVEAKSAGSWFENNLKGTPYRKIDSNDWEKEIDKLTKGKNNA